MGYSTDFDGQFKIVPSLGAEDRLFLTKLASTRRMARNVGPEYGVEGEFYVNDTGCAGQDHDDTVIDYNRQPSTQPGLWCQWIPNESGDALVWDGGEKFYEYVEWLQYLLDKVLVPRGYVLNGKVTWQGEDSSDFGMIEVTNNVVVVREGHRVYV